MVCKSISSSVGNGCLAEGDGSRRVLRGEKKTHNVLSGSRFTVIWPEDHAQFGTYTQPAAGEHVAGEPGCPKTSAPDRANESQVWSNPRGVPSHFLRRRSHLPTECSSAQLGSAKV